MATAAAALSRAAPGQRDSIIAQVAAVAWARQQPQGADEQPKDQPPPPVAAAASPASDAVPQPQPPAGAQPVYEAPEWAGVPEGIPYAIEVRQIGMLF